MDYLTIVLLSCILVLGIISSYLDLKKGIILNKVLLIFLGIAFVINLGFINEIGSLFVLRHLIDLILALAIGVVLWLSGLWSAGDAKLFFTFNALIPSSFYAIKSNLSLDLLAFVFVPVFVYYLFMVLWRTSWKEKFLVIKRINLKLIWNVFLSIFVFMNVIYLFSSYTGIYFNLFYSIILIFLLIVVLEKIVKVKLKYVLLFLLPVVIILRFEQIFNLEFAYEMGIILISFVVLRFFFLNLFYIAFSKPVYIENLKKGMFYADNIDLKTFSVMQEIPLSFVNALEAKRKRLFKGNCLSSEDVSKIQKLHSSGKVKEHVIRIYDKIAFAPFISVGCMLVIFYYLLFL